MAVACWPATHQERCACWPCDDDPARPVRLLNAKVERAGEQLLTGPERQGVNMVHALLDSGAQKVRRDLQGKPAIQAKLLETLGAVYLICATTCCGPRSSFTSMTGCARTATVNEAVKLARARALRVATQGADHEETAAARQRLATNQR